MTDRLTDRRTDGRTDRIAISISRVSMLTRDKNEMCRHSVFIAVRVTFHPCAVLTPLNYLLPMVHVGSDGRRNRSCKISA